MCAGAQTRLLHRPTIGGACMRGVLLGIVGAIVGGFLSNLLGRSTGSRLDFTAGWWQRLAQ